MGGIIDDSQKYEPIKFNYNFNEGKTKKLKKKKVIYKKPVRYNFTLTNHIDSPKYFNNINQNSNFFSETETEHISDKEKTDDNILKNRNPSLIQNNNNNAPENTLNLIFPLENLRKYDNNNYYDDSNLVEEIIKNSSNNEYQPYNFEDNYFNYNNFVGYNPTYTPNRSIVRKIFPSYESPIEINNNNANNTSHYYNFDNFQYNNNLHYLQNKEHDNLFQSIQI